MVVIPTYDERENLATVVAAVLALPEQFAVLVVDDNSPDGTGELAERLAARDPRVHVLRRARKEGIGPAYVAGFEYALGWGAEHVLQMDADLSHDPADLSRLLAACAQADVALGSRYVGGVRVLDWSAKRLLLSLGASYYVRLVLGMPVFDPTGGFKCWRRELLLRIDLSRLHSRGYSFQIEMTYLAWRLGARIVEVPIVFTERRRGGSKIHRNIIYEAVYVLGRLRLGAALRRRGDRGAGTGP